MLRTKGEGAFETVKLEKTLLATWLLADQSARTEHFAELVDKNGRILEQHGSVSTGIYAMKDLPDRNLAGCFPDRAQNKREGSRSRLCAR